MALLSSKQYETGIQMVKHFIISASGPAGGHPGVKAECSSRSSWFGFLKYFDWYIHPSAVNCILHLLYGVLVLIKVQLDPIYAWIL